MKLRYYLRGLGIGILVTALILTIVPGEKESLSDAEIRTRALQLGMVDSSSLTLADVQGTTAGGSQNGKQDGNAEKPDAEVVTQESEATLPQEEKATPESESVQPQEEQPKEEQSEKELSEKKQPAQESEATQPSAETTEDYATITIKSGDGSYTVAKALEAAGLIADAKEFDNYLCDNGYSRSIGTGTYKIALGSTEEEIAKIISRKR